MAYGLLNVTKKSCTSRHQWSLQCGSMLVKAQPQRFVSVPNTVVVAVTCVSNLQNCESETRIFFKSRSELPYSASGVAKACDPGIHRECNIDVAQSNEPS